MITNTKATPKSCSCKQCVFGKSSKTGNVKMKSDERAYRRNANKMLRQYINEDSDTPLPARKGNYYD